MPKIKGKVTAALAIFAFLALSAFNSREVGAPYRSLGTDDNKVIVKITNKTTKEVFYTRDIPEPRAWNFIQGGDDLAEAYDCLVLFSGSAEYAAADLVPYAERWSVPERFDEATFDERFGAYKRKTLANAAQ